MTRHAEMSAKPIGLVIPSEDDLAAFKALSQPQKGYFLHWVRSNQRYAGDWFTTAIRKAKEQRPS